VSSILDDVKHALGLLPGNTAFDSDVKMHINSVFSTLNQLGVGPNEGFMITGNSEQWETVITRPQLNNVKSYMFLRVKLLHDPPQVGFVITSMENQIKELEYRMFVEADGTILPGPQIIDGGGP
jgi:hypothetical protein